MWALREKHDCAHAGVISEATFPRVISRATIMVLIFGGMALAGLEALGADLGAVHDRVAAVELEGVLERVQPFALVALVAAVDQPVATGPQQGGRAVEALVAGSTQ